MVAMAAPMGPSKVVVPTETGNPASAPAVQVPANGGMLSHHDMVMLFARDIPLATAKPVREGAVKQWTLPGALKANELVKTAASTVREATNRFESLFHTILPLGSHADDVTLKASVTIQKKLLVLDLSDLAADSGDDLAEVLGQHVTIQVVSNKLDTSASNRNSPFSNARHRPIMFMISAILLNCGA